MAVYAITEIQHGHPDGSQVVVSATEQLDGLDWVTDDMLRDWIAGGSAVEVGPKRKFTEVPQAATPQDELTAKRDALVADSLRGGGAEVKAEAPKAEPEGKK